MTVFEELCVNIEKRILSIDDHPHPMVLVVGVLCGAHTTLTILGRTDDAEEVYRLIRKVCNLGEGLGIREIERIAADAQARFPTPPRRRPA